MRFPFIVLLGATVLTTAPGARAQPPETAAPAQPVTPLRVCNDPDNWPLSHRDGTGLENRLARLLADALGAPLHTEWITLQGRIVAATLSVGRCDVLMGVPSGFPRVATSRPYYRSTFVWVQRTDDAPLGPLADERLAGMRIGVPRIRHDDEATPPAWVLGQSGRARLVGYALEEGEMPARLVEAVASGRVDAAVLWGPQAGWHVRRHAGALQMSPVTAPANPELPMQVDLSLAVRSADEALLGRLDRALDVHRAEVEALLREFAVPVAAAPAR